MCERDIVGQWVNRMDDGAVGAGFKSSAVHVSPDKHSVLTGAITSYMVACCCIVLLAGMQTLLKSRRKRM